jgi:hypothetical protein
MSSPVKTYRVVCFDAALKIIVAEFIEAASDEEAIARREKAGFGSKCEVWDGHRLVAQLDAERRQA